MIKEVIDLKRIMIDLDDTITTDAYLNVVNEYLHTNYTYNDIKKYWVDEIIPEEQLEDYLDFFYNKIDLYKYANVHSTAIEVIEKLTKYYEVVICSAYIDYRDLQNCANLVVHKHRWLSKNLPFIKPDNYIFTSNKKCINAEIKIDDKISNLEGDAELKLLITAYHNKEISDDELKEKNIIRVNNWNDIADILLNH